ncbi:lipase 3-like isoform X2 [Anoplophora glabripennis]|uniref:lipase 3-like isoform X2 n=1 Tax=Anoplophora glabripennis TaxID=217634 RepID=UPI000C774343|nr:lipase 3-like isoform X2 [Anoplophora glabripennis]
MAGWSPLLLLQIILHVSVPLEFITHPEADLNMQKVIKHGYPIEIHEVTTEDNYILTLHRVPHGRRSPSNNTKRSPVLLLHGMAAQVEYFLLLGRRSLIYYLADRGYDVWILNARGTRYSQKHKYFDIEDNRYWKFSYHEIGTYDIPANIDYIMNKTNQKIFLIGHSQGNTCHFVMATERPEYNDKIKISVLYGPSVLLKYADYPLVNAISYFVDIYQMIYDGLGMDVIFPMNDSMDFIFKVLCSETTYFMKFCRHILSNIGSHASHLITQEVVSLVFTVPLARLAARQIFHYMQCIKSGVFRQYDYGEIDNLRRYRTKTPPEYNLTKAVAPVAIFYAERDEFATIKGSQEIAKVLPNVILLYKVPYKYFNHIDFILASNASSLVYKRNVQLFKNFDNGQLRDKRT